jgi:hypothetical protein
MSLDNTASSEYTKYIRNKTNNKLREADRLNGIEPKSRNSIISSVIFNPSTNLAAFSRVITKTFLRIFAGTGVYGQSGEGGLAINAQLDRPRGIGVDRTNENIYIATTPNIGILTGRILKVNLATNIITRVAGDTTRPNSALFGTGIITSVASNGTLVTYTIATSLSWPSHTFSVGQNIRVRDIPSPNNNLNLDGIVTSRTDTTVTITSSQPPLGNTAVIGTMGIKATLAGITQPYNIVFDSVGNMYFPNQLFGQPCILKIDTDGYILRYVGSGNGYNTGGGNGNNTHRLNPELNCGDPRGIAIDANDNLYIAETDIYTVRRVDAGTGNVTTIAGRDRVRPSVSESNYPTNGIPGTDALFRGPTALAFDSTQSNLYILSTWQVNDRTEYSGIYRYNFATQSIYVIMQSPSGTSGDGGPAINAQLFSPRGMTLDKNDNIFISDSSGGIRRIDANGIITTYTDGVNYNLAWHILFVNENLYAITTQNQVAVITPPQRIFV